MQRNRPLSEQAKTVLLAFAVDPDSWRHGYDLCQETGLKAGTLYPILIRLADRGWLETEWETEMAAGRPPRHLYRLTSTGRAQADCLATAEAEAAKTKRARLTPTMGGV
jgi:DNA-binding PadR family transcriptional regulator